LPDAAVAQGVEVQHGLLARPQRSVPHRRDSGRTRGGQPDPAGHGEEHDRSREHSSAGGKQRIPSPAGPTGHRRHLRPVRSPRGHGETPSSLASPGCTAGGTPPPGGAFAEPRTSTPLLAGRVHRAAGLSVPGDVSRPLRDRVPPYPAVHGSGAKKGTANPKPAPLPFM